MLADRLLGATTRLIDSDSSALYAPYAWFGLVAGFSNIVLQFIIWHSLDSGILTFSKMQIKQPNKAWCRKTRSLSSGKEKFW